MVKESKAKLRESKARNLRIRGYFVNQGFYVKEDKRGKVIRLYRPKDMQGKKSDNRYMGSSKNYNALLERYNDTRNFRYVTEVTTTSHDCQSLAYQGEDTLDFKQVKFKRVNGLKNKQVIIKIIAYRRFTDSYGEGAEGHSYNFKSMRFFPDACDEAYCDCMYKLGFTPERITIIRIDVREFR